MDGHVENFGLSWTTMDSTDRMITAIQLVPNAFMQFHGLEVTQTKGGKEYPETDEGKRKLIAEVEKFGVYNHITCAYDS